MNKQNFLIILGTAYLATTPGQCSPDNALRECEYSRDRVANIAAKLKKLGYNVEIDYLNLQPNFYINSSNPKGAQSLELTYRCKVVNDLCKRYGSHNCLYVSIHVDAAGNGLQWMNAGGWTAYTSKGHTRADKLAECLYDAAQVHLKDYAANMERLKKSGVYSAAQKPIRTDKTDGDRDKEENFYILAHTSCPAVLTENLFQDNKADVAFLLSDEGKEAIENIHVDGIINYINNI